MIILQPIYAYFFVIWEGFQFLLESQGSKRSEICSTDLHTIYSNQRSKSTFSQQQKFKQAYMRKKIMKKISHHSIQLDISYDAK